MNLKAKTSPKRNIVFAVENIGRDLHWRLWRLFWYYCLHYCCWGLTLEERQYLRESASSFRKNTFFSFYKICAGQVRCEVGIFMMWFVTCEWWGWSRLVCLSLDDGHQIYFLLRVLINEHCYKKHCHTEQSEALICEVMMLQLTFHWRSHLKCKVDCQNRNITKTRLCHNFKILTFQSLIINSMNLLQSLIVYCNCLQSC